MDKSAKTSQPINELLAKRWSPRAFDPEAKISAEHKLALVEAARWTPSSYGDEPWAYVLCDRHSDPEGFQRAKDCLVEFNQMWAGNATLLILAVAKQTFRSNDKPNRHGQYDTGAASLALVLQAEALGLRAHQMAGFDAAKAKADFNVPDGYDCIAMIAVGTQVSADRLPDDMRDGELAERKRLDVSENFFAGKWGVSL